MLSLVDSFCVRENMDCSCSCPRLDSSIRGMLAGLSMVKQEQQLFFHGRGFSAILLYGLAGALSDSGIDVSVALFWLFCVDLMEVFAVLCDGLFVVFVLFACAWSCLMVLRSEHFMVRRGFSGRAICGFALHLSY